MDPGAINCEAITITVYSSATIAHVDASTECLKDYGVGSAVKPRTEHLCVLQLCFNNIGKRIVPMEDTLTVSFILKMMMFDLSYI